MNFEFYIARRLITSKDRKNSISAPIIKIAITAIAIGVVMMLIAIATGLGLQNKIREKVSAFNGDIIISYYDTNFSNDSQHPISKNQPFYPEFKDIEGIRHVQATASKGGVIRTETDFEGVVVKGVGTDYDWSAFEEYLIEGRLPNFEGDLNQEVLISEYLANRMHFGVGDRITAFFLNDEISKNPRSRGFEVVGIYNSGFQEFDEQFVMADIRHIQMLNRWEDDQIGTFEVFVDDFSEIETIGHQVYMGIDSSLDAQTIRGKFASIFEWLDLFDFNILAIIGIMILVAGINMITALLVMILERTRMIGILKAVGASDRSVRKIFLHNAMYLILLGLAWGNAIGLGLLMLQKYGKVIPLDPNTYYVTEAPVYLSWGYIALMNIGTFVLCLVMLLVGAILITKISPVKAIHFD